MSTASMHYLARVYVPFDLSKEEINKRQLAFQEEENAICERYLENGYQFERNFKFAESHNTA